jgi:hypothetical protein
VVDALPNYLATQSGTSGLVFSFSRLEKPPIALNRRSERFRALTLRAAACTIDAGTWL